MLSKILGRYPILIEHFPASFLIGMCGYLLTGDLFHFIAALIFGWLIDIDHIVDYALFLKATNTKPSMGGFLSGSYFKESGVLFLPLHSVELCVGALLCAVTIKPPYQGLVVTASLAMAAHIVQDYFTHKPTPLGYFFAARLLNGFDLAWFCDENTHQRTPG